MGSPKNVALRKAYINGQCPLLKTCSDITFNYIYLPAAVHVDVILSWPETHKQI